MATAAPATTSQPASSTRRSDRRADPRPGTSAVGFGRRVDGAGSSRSHQGRRACRRRPGRPRRRSRVGEDRPAVGRPPVMRRRRRRRRDRRTDAAPTRFGVVETGPAGGFGQDRDRRRLDGGGDGLEASTSCARRPARAPARVGLGSRRRHGPRSDRGLGDRVARGPARGRGSGSGATVGRGIGSARGRGSRAAAVGRPRRPTRAARRTPGRTAGRRGPTSPQSVQSMVLRRHRDTSPFGTGLGSRPGYSVADDRSAASHPVGGRWTPRTSLSRATSAMVHTAPRQRSDDAREQQPDAPQDDERDDRQHERAPRWSSVPSRFAASTADQAEPRADRGRQHDQRQRRSSAARTGPARRADGGGSSGSLRASARPTPSPASTIRRAATPRRSRRPSRRSTIATTTSGVARRTRTTIDVDMSVGLVSSR